jgi:hypothetical protein
MMVVHVLYGIIIASTALYFIPTLSGLFATGRPDSADGGQSILRTWAVWSLNSLQLIGIKFVEG